MRYAVTGALSYTGRYLAKSLLDRGHEVVNLSRRAAPIAAPPLDAADVDVLRASRRDPAFQDPAALAEALEGCDALFATYWVRFVEGSGDPHAAAAANLERLFAAAREANVRKIVFASHTRTSPESPFPYIAGKARANEALRRCGADYAIVRPCGLFGDTAEESILMNNAAWVLRRSPLFLCPGDGAAAFQPVHVRDMADLMLELGLSETSGEELDACGPDAPSARELFSALRDATGSYATVATAPFLPTWAITQLTRPIDMLTGDTRAAAPGLAGPRRASVLDVASLESRVTGCSTRTTWTCSAAA
mmetsp:Transcript_4487/g.13274  ORF Transcript_4487/g.13274 Transcript_4487/m.13274 type:complete len:307 (-) Transcript_4487:156-1076(-)